MSYYYDASLPYGGTGHVKFKGSSFAFSAKMAPPADVIICNFI